MPKWLKILQATATLIPMVIKAVIEAYQVIVSEIKEPDAATQYAKYYNETGEHPNSLSLVKGDNKNA